MKVLPALAVAMLLACHASAQLIAVSVDPNLPDLYFEPDSTAVEPEGRHKPEPVAPAVTTLAWASSTAEVAGDPADCRTACGGYGLASVESPTSGLPLCRSSSSTSSFWYGSQLSDFTCGGRDSTNAPVTTDPGTFLCGCCGTINRNGISFSTGCATSVSTEAAGPAPAPAVGGAACPAGPWGTAPGPNGFPAGATAPALCTKTAVDSTGAVFVEWGSAYPPAGAAIATCATYNDATVPEPAPFNRVCFAVRPFTPPPPPTKPGHGRKMM